MKVRSSLLAKIYLATAVAVTTFFAAAGWFFLYQASAALHSGIEQEVRASLATADASLEARTEHLATASALLASTSDIRSAFSSRDTATIRDTAGEFWAKAETGHKHIEPVVFAVAGPAGIVLASVDSETSPALQSGQQLPRDVLEPARRAFPQQSRAYAEWDGTVWQVLATPVYVDAGNRAALLNILVAAHPLTEQTLRDLKERTGGIDFLLRAGGRTTLATVDAPSAARISSQPEHFAVHSTTLRNGEGATLAELWAVRPLQDVEARIGALRQKMIVAWLIAMTAGLALSYALARRIVRPVRTLNQAAQEVGRGNYSVRAPEDSSDELGVLARTFNRMAVAIQESRDEQVRSGQIMAVGRLAASIAHDLRNPLSAVVGGSEMLAEFDLTAPQVKETATHVHNAARRMERLLAEIGQVARTKAAEREDCLVTDLIGSAVDSQQARTERQHVAIHQSIEGQFTVHCDRSRVERVLVNLIGNALEAMPDGGEIDIRVWCADGMVWIEVSDTGPGVPAEIRAKLFQPFVTSGKKDGLGLGLALARQTMIEHGGDLESKESDRGARFRLRLPPSPVRN
ncbi:MAG TPA: HAMP domain-containing sensor histidine kinase [Bryobacteraceae bacterium]|nr:HAMP domain-containing sensor histidine kinase [Bryobacteraceae bacterium]